MNETDVQTVVRHLVDEVRSGALAQNPGAIQIALTQRAQLRARQGSHGLEERTLVTPAVAGGELACDLGYIRQLHRSFDQGVAGENLLEQRRAGARQAEDEDRIARLGAAAGALCKELPGEERLRAAHETRVLIGAVRVGFAPDAVALRVVG